MLNLKISLMGPLTGEKITSYVTSAYNYNNVHGFILLDELVVKFFFLKLWDELVMTFFFWTNIYAQVTSSLTAT